MCFISNSFSKFLSEFNLLMFIVAAIATLNFITVQCEKSDEKLK